MINEFKLPGMNRLIYHIGIESLSSFLSFLFVMFQLVDAKTTKWTELSTVNTEINSVITARWKSTMTVDVRNGNRLVKNSI